MRRFGWLTLGLALTAVGHTPAMADDPKPRALGVDPAYSTLGKLSVLAEGRKKPLDTMAREEVKQIFGRETIKIQDAAKENKITQAWGPVAALFDWSVRPEFWDEQPIILVEYVPLKRLILADSIESRLAAVAGKSTTSAADRDALEKLAANAELSASSLKAFLAKSALTAEDKAVVSVVAAELSEEHKWLTPRQMEEAKMPSGGGPRVPFNEWFREIVQKKRMADASTTGDVKLTEVEKRANEAGTRLTHYQAIRDREMRSVEPMLVMPRPSNKAYLDFLAKIYAKAQKTRDTSDLTLLELDGAKALDTYWNELPIDERTVPGTNEAFDKEFVAWLKDSSAWVPLKAMLDTKPEDLEAAGFPLDKVVAFQKAFRELNQAEDAAPGTVAESKTSALVSAARALGESVSPSYPTVEAVNRETHFNETNPFWKAPIAYFLGVVFLSVVLGLQGFERGSALAKIGQVLYGLGLTSLVGGIGFEVIGFYYRVRISGWAPVTNMYETVIFVSAIAAVLGLVFEIVYRKTYAGLAGSGVALLGTILAANVPLLDPDIKTLQPVLRSNYWLTIHVLTEVASYGAFMQAAGLGLIATFYYLTATYRRSPSFTELALPVVPGLPMLSVGAVGLLASYGLLGPSWVVGDGVFYVSSALAGLGGMLTLAAVASILGEMVSRFTFRDDEAVVQATASGEQHASAVHGATTVQTVTVGEGSGSGSVATVTKPTVAEIRAMAVAAIPKLDARGRAMQATAAKIKPLSNSIYRTMQVGVLLIAAGTILGGIWADYSWGRFWGWDPKEVWALITLLVYLIPLHGRFAGWFNTFALVVASVVCSLSVIMAWYGVNFVLGVGLHSYGFTEGGGQGIVLSAVAAVMALPLAAGYRRSLGSRPLIESA